MGKCVLYKIIVLFLQVSSYVHFSQEVCFPAFLLRAQFNPLLPSSTTNKLSISENLNRYGKQNCKDTLLLEGFEISIHLAVSTVVPL